MKCAVCFGGETKPGLSTRTLTRDDTTVVIKDVPAEICTTCGEVYLDAEIVERVLTMAEEVFAAHVEVGVREYKAA